jgi:hypothetical protein
MIGEVTPGLVLAPEKRKLALRQTTLLRQRRERAGHLEVEQPM